MFSPYDLEILLTARQADLLREASRERLAKQALHHRSPRVRSRLAEVLYALALRLDPCAVPARSPARWVTN